jgi:hypothetical protein
MIDGLWTVEFTSTLNRSGKGVFVFNNGRVLGGDQGYYYSGTYRTAGTQIEGRVNIVRFDPLSMSVFGNIDHFSLSFTGDFNEYRLTAAATIEGLPSQQIRVVAQKKEDMLL